MSDYASDFLIVVEQVDGDGQVVNFIQRTPCPIKAQQLAEKAAHDADVDLSFISLNLVEV